MMWLKVLLIVLVLMCVVERGDFISSKASTKQTQQFTPENIPEESLEMLWNLTSFALMQTNLQGRQRYPGGGVQYPELNPYQGDRYPNPYLQQTNLQQYPRPQNLQNHQNQGLYQGVQNPGTRYGYPVTNSPYQQYPQSPYQQNPYRPYPPFPQPQSQQSPLSSIQNLLGFTPGFNPGPGQASIMDVLHSVAQNDELHCVPKLLCELTSNTRSDSTQSSLLPFNVNMDSLLGLLSAVGPSASSNPLFLFGRAALLGYSSRGSSCYNAFSRCPNDPDKLVNYLNNYNGGFFRYFQGNPRPQPQYQGGYQGYQYQGLQGYPQNGQYGYSGLPQQQNNGYYQQRPQYYPQKRILTNNNLEEANKYPYRFPYAPQYEGFNQDSGNRFTGIKFPVENVVSNAIDQSFGFQHNTNQRYKSAKTLTFPDDSNSYKVSGTKDERRYYQNFRSGKTLSFPDTHYSQGLNFQMVRPNHVASPYIFPTRTGTGEFLLDTEELY